MTTAVATRACTECGAEGPLDSFPADKNSRGGRRPRCRPCYNARGRELREARKARNDKRCEACWKAVPLTGFPANPYRPDGRGSWCTACCERAGRKTRNAIAMRRRAREEADAQQRAAAARIENGPDRAWWRRSACGMNGTDKFFPNGITEPALTQAEDAKAFCLTRCPVVDDCRKWALDTGQNDGVLGGMSEYERRAVKRKEARNRARASA